MFCSKCGAAIPAGVSFCGNCGTPVGQVSTPPLAQPQVPLGMAQPPVVSPYSGVAGFHNTQNFPYAGFWIRFAAHLIDGLLIGLVLMALLVPLFFLTGLGATLQHALPNHDDTEMNPAFAGALFSLIFLAVGVGLLLQWLYYAYLESGPKQATWGKQAMGIYVSDIEGQPVSFGRASGRFFAKILSGMIPTMAGYWMAAFTARKQALHDMIANTLVLKR